MPTGRLGSGRRGGRPTIDEGPAVTREQIIETAYHLARTESLGAVQVRRIARELGVWPQAVYHYIPSKANLLEEVADRALATIRPARLASTAPWDQRLLDLFYRVANVFAQHPGLADFVVTRDFLWSDRITALADEGLALLFEGGLSPAQARHAYASLAALILGEAQLQRRSGRGATVHRRPVDAKRFPAAAKAMADADALADRRPSGVETFVAGLASTHRPRKRRTG